MTSPTVPPRPTHVFHQAMVSRFHQAFGHPVCDTVTIPDAKHRLLRVRLIAEELKEYADASGVPFEYKVGVLAEVSKEVNVIEAADALGDLDYVVQGSNVVWGFPGQEIFHAIHTSNMSKLGRDGKPVLDEHGKVVKGPNYKPPQGFIESILGKWGW